MGARITVLFACFAALATRDPALAQSSHPDGTRSGAPGTGTPSPSQPLFVVRSFAPVGGLPRGVEISGGRGWTTDAGSKRIFRIDPLTGAVLGSFPSPGNFPADLAFDGTHLWNTDPDADRIFELDPVTGAVLRSIPSPGPGPNGLAWDGVALWSADWWFRTIYRVDPADGHVLQSFPSPAANLTYGLAWSGTSLYLADAGSGQLLELDPLLGSVLDVSVTPTLNPMGLGQDGSSLWYLDGIDLLVFELMFGPPTGTRRTSFGALKALYR